MSHATSSKPRLPQPTRSTILFQQTTIDDDPAPVEVEGALTLLAVCDRVAIGRWKDAVAGNQDAARRFFGGEEPYKRGAALRVDRLARLVGKRGQVLTAPCDFNADDPLFLFALHVPGPADN